MPFYSSLAGGDEAGQFPQGLCPIGEGCKRGFGVLQQSTQPLPRVIGPKPGNERGLAAACVLGDGLAESRGIAFSVEQIVGRVETALRYVAPQRITLNPDCGFAPGSAAVVSIDEVYQKLKNEVAAAGTLRERYG